MYYRGREIDDDDYQEFRRNEREDKKRERELLAHPDCRDPGHPGCNICMEEED